MKVLPFFISTGQRDAERVNAWDAILCPNYKFLPFQIQRGALNSTGFTELRLFNCEGGGGVEYISEFEQTVNEKTDYDFITYNGEALDTYMDNGVYYLRGFDGNEFYRSEWFDVQDIQPSVLTSWTSDFASFSVSTSGSRIGVDILSATGVGGSIATSNGFNTVVGEIFVLTYDYTNNSDEDITLQITDDSGDGISNTVSVSEGVNTSEFTITLGSVLPSLLEIVQLPVGGAWSLGRLSLRRKVGDYVHMEYTNTNDIQGKESIFYASGFTQEVYLNAQLNSPAHESIETGEEKNGVFQAEKIVDKLVHSVISYESRNLFKALRLLPMHDSIEILDEVGNVYNPDQGNVRVAMDWTTFDTGTLRIDWNEVGDVWTSNMDNIV